DEGPVHVPQDGGGQGLGGAHADLRSRSGRHRTSGTRDSTLDGTVPWGRVWSERSVSRARPRMCPRPCGSATPGPTTKSTNPLHLQDIDREAGCGMWILVAFGLAGGVAQLVDGTLGMGFGVTSATVLLFMGIAPVTASAATHAAKLPTTFISGVSHWREGNVD